MEVRCFVSTGFPSAFLGSLVSGLLYALGAQSSLKGPEACSRPSLGYTSFCLNWGLQPCNLVHGRRCFSFWVSYLKKKKKLLLVHTLTPAQWLTLEHSYFSFSFGILFSRHVLIQTFGMTASQETVVASATFLCRLL